MSETAIVTGAAGGIGEAVARRLARSGAKCVLVDRNPRVEQVASEIDGIAVVGDLADPELSMRAVHLAGEHLELLVLNAGVNSPDKDLAALDLDGYQAVVAVNQHAVVYGLRAALPVMRANGGGSVVATASLAALQGASQDPIYTMTKHAVVGLVRALARPLAQEGIRFSAVCPGLVDTPLTAAGRERFRVAGIPMLGVDEVAAVVEEVLRTAEAGTELVVRADQAPLRYAAAPVF